MTSREFAVKCRPYNIQYRDLFGHIPSPSDYAGGRDKFFDALVKAVEAGITIDHYLEPATAPEGAWTQG
jgi:hypothetical protein